MPDNDKKFLKFKARILAINGGNTPDVLTSSITVPDFRGYQAGDVIPAGTKLSDIINKEFKSTPVTYTITISSTGSGTVTPTGVQTVNRGASLTVTATPALDNQLKSFTVDGNSVSNPYTFTNIQANHIVAVEFEPIPVADVIITASAGTGGTITPSGAIIVAQGGSQAFTIAADSGYKIKDVKVDGASVGAVAIYDFNNVTTPHTIAAEFEVDTPVVVTHKITATAGAGGAISPSGEVVVDEGASKNFIITANSGYQVKDVKVDGTSVGIVGSYQFDNVVADHTIAAEFEVIPVDTYTINVTNNTPTFGTITPTSGTVNVGTATTVTATPNSGYQIKTLTLDDVDQTSPFTINGVKDQTYNVVVEFEAIPSGNIYNQAYTDAGGRVWVQPTASNIVLGTPVADSAAAMEQIKAGTFAWTSKSQSRSIETFVIAKSLGRVTSIMSALGEMIGNAMTEDSITIDGIDYWVYYNTSTVGAGGGSYTITGTEA